MAFSALILKQRGKLPLAEPWLLRDGGLASARAAQLIWCLLP